MQLFSVMILRKACLLVFVLNVKNNYITPGYFHTEILRIIKYGRVMTTKKL